MVVSAPVFCLTDGSGAPACASGAEVLHVVPGRTVAQAVYLSGRLEPLALCSGIGRCGRCRIRFLPKGVVAPEPLPEDAAFFSRAELKAGWRLGCLHQALPGMLIGLPSCARLAQEAGFRSTLRPVSRPGGQAVLLAVDLGTTSLRWRLFSRDGRFCREGGGLNPQLASGSDVISRLRFARTPDGVAQLRRLALLELERLLREAPAPPAAACLAANPAMTCLALGRDTATLAAAPYRLPMAGGVWEHCPGLPPLWIPPLLSPFVGGDITAGYAALAADSLASGTDPATSGPVEFPFLLADLGTNAELLLALSPDRAVAASVALGPALEGIGLTFGSEARPGAVSAFSLTPQGLAAQCLTRDATPLSAACAGPDPATDCPGITATGYLSLLRLLRACDVLSPGGRFTPGNSPMLSGPLERLRSQPLRRPLPGGAPWLPLPLGFSLNAGDVEEILKVKAAFSLGVRLLLQAGGVESRDLRRVFLAGALGEHLSGEVLEELGFFPPGLDRRLRVAGNTALAGASLLLGSSRLRRALRQWAGRVETLDLAAHPAFQRHFPEHMVFSWEVRA